MIPSGSFENIYESIDEVHLPAGIRGIALIGTTIALSFLRFVFLFNEHFLCWKEARHEI
jgi:hypothetical protein